MLKMKRLAYYSKAAHSFDSSELIGLAAEAARFNALDGITGVLFYSNGRFAQIFEGVDEAAHELLARLERDPRHTGLKVIIEEEIKDPLFTAWDMRLIKEDETNSATVSRMVTSQSLPNNIADFIDNFAARMDA